MAKQVINIGAAPNDASGDTLRVAFDKSNDNFTELYNSVQNIESSMLTAASIMRSKKTVACNGTAGQVISFSSQFVTNYSLQIEDYEGIGIEVTFQNENGFIITSLNIGNFGYLAFIEI